MSACAEKSARSAAAVVSRAAQCVHVNAGYQLAADSDRRTDGADDVDRRVVNAAAIGSFQVIENPVLAERQRWCLNRRRQILNVERPDRVGTEFASALHALRL